MKKLLLISPVLVVAALPAIAAPSPVKTRTFTGEALSSISTNGEWAVGRNENEFSIIIRNLITDEVWEYDEFNGITGTGTQYAMALDRAVSDTGVVVGEVNDKPSYWTDGVWKPLPVNGYTGSMQVGSITPDGSMIVGAIGNANGMLEDIMFTKPCVWYRNADGSYGNPEMLPYPEWDMTNAVPQYFTPLSVSDDGKTIGALMTCNYGFPIVPYAFTRSESGEWTYRMFAEDLINPDGLEFPPYYGEYRGPERPNWELYITEEETEEYFAAFPAWAEEQEELGYTQEDIELLALIFVGTFMHGEKQKEYQDLVSEYLENYLGWLELQREYETVLGTVLANGMDFIFNNMRIAPDGSKIYATGTHLELVRPDNPEDPFDTSYRPVIFDVKSGEATVLSSDHNVLLGSVTTDGSVLGRQYYRDSDMVVAAYIYPQGAFEDVMLLDYFKEMGNTVVVDWMEDNMLHQVLFPEVDGDIEVIDAYGMGVPLATPDMSLILFNTSTAYWLPEEDYLYVSYVLNTGMDKNGIESVGTGDSGSFAVMTGGIISVNGDISSLEIYNLAGAEVFRMENPSGTINTRLAGGIYVVRATSSDGISATKKAAF